MSKPYKYEGPLTGNRVTDNPRTPVVPVEPRCKKHKLVKPCRACESLPEPTAALTPVPVVEPRQSEPTWKCKARSANMGGNDPQDCNWPQCGCDPYANKVLDTIDESGFDIIPKAAAAPPQVPSPAIRSPQESVDLAKWIIGYVRYFDQQQEEDDCCDDSDLFTVIAEKLKEER